MKTNSNEVLRLTSGGLVGINTSNPQTALQIDGNLPQIRARSTQSTSGSSALFEFGHDDGSGNFTKIGHIGDVGSGDYTEVFSSDRVMFNVNYGYRFMLGNNGEIGLGGTFDTGTAGQFLTSAGPGAQPAAVVSVREATRTYRRALAERS